MGIEIYLCAGGVHPGPVLDLGGDFFLLNLQLKIAVLTIRPSIGSANYSIVTTEKFRSIKVLYTMTSSFTVSLGRTDSPPSNMTDLGNND